METVERNLIDQDGADDLDLTRCQFVDPFGLVAIACKAQFVANRGQTSYAVPVDRSFAIYQERMRLPQVLDAQFGIRASHIHGVREHDRRDVLSELTVFSNWSDAKPMAEMVLNKVNADDESAEAIWLCLCEACENVGEHSGARGFIAAQTYQLDQPGEYVTLAVGDTGLGIRATLQRAFPRILSDQDALSLVIKGGYTGVISDPERGTGIHAMMTAVQRLNGDAVLRTGSQSAKITSSGTIFPSSGRLRGTIIGLRLPCIRGRKSR